MVLLTAGGGNAGRRSAACFQLILIAVATCAVVLAARGGWAQSCEDCDQCMTNCVCQPDGTCQGTPLPNTTSCDDGDPCTVSDHCQNGSCVGGGNASDSTACDDYNACTINDHCASGTCVGGSNKADGDPCTIPGLGLCGTGTCQVIPFVGTIFCLPQNQCEDACHWCDPDTGQCTMNLCSMNPCSTGECDQDGGCIPGNEGAACDDYDVCTSNDQCQDGECVGTAGGTPPPAGTATPTPTATPILTTCVGDCDGDGYITVTEILTGINIALGNLDVSACEKFDANGDGQVTVDEILTAVNYALNGCPEIPPSTTPGAPTATRTPTSPGGTPTPTTSAGATPTGGSTPSIGTRAAGTIESTTSTFLVIPNLLSALLGHLPASFSGSGATTVIPPTAFSCSSGGGTFGCDQDIIFGIPPSLGPPTFTITLNSCQVSSSTGATLTFSGTLTATGQEGDSCLAVPTDVTVAIQNLTVQTQTAAGTTTATFTNFSAGVSLSCSAGSCSCHYDSVEMHPTGTIAVAGTSANNQVTFGSGSSIYISVYTYNAQCVPTFYDMEVDGDVTLTTNGTTFAATYDVYTISDDATSGQDMVEVDGDVYSSCFGDTVTFYTIEDIALDDPCPSAGVVDAYANTSGNTDEITYSSSGVHIDFEDGSNADFPNCLDPRLFACPGS